MTDRIYSVDEIKRVVAPIAQHYGVDRVFLFGSYARGEATSDSDLDLRVPCKACLLWAECMPNWKAHWARSWTYLQREAWTSDS